MCKLLILENECDLLQYNIVCSSQFYYAEEIDGSCLPMVLYDTSGGYYKNLTSFQLYIDEFFDIYLPMNGYMKISMEPLPKALYLLFLRHPEGILLKHISDYREELEYIYRKVSGRKNPTVIRRLMDEITNPLNNMLHKNLSIIRSSFLKKLSDEAAQSFIPIRNRGHEQYVLLDASRINLPEILR